jgi:hypothetical protein
LISYQANGNRVINHDGNPICGTIIYDSRARQFSPYQKVHKFFKAADLVHLPGIFANGGVVEGESRYTCMRTNGAVRMMVDILFARLMARSDTTTKEVTIPATVSICNTSNGYRTFLA